MKRKINPFWEFVGYLSLSGLVIAQITVGYWYLFAQIIYLACNIANLVRAICQKMPPSYIVKDSTFTAITLGLIIIWIIR